MQHSETIQRFLTWLAGGHSPATVQSYKYGFYNLEKWLRCVGKSIEKCTLDDLMQYVQVLENRGLKGKTRAHYVTVLRALWSWLDKQGMVPFKADMIPMPRVIDTERRPYLSEEEYRRILDSFDEYFPIELRNKTIVAFLFATGVRLSEMLIMDVDQIDLEERRARIKTFKRKNHYRDVYWNAEVNELLRKWLDVRKKMLEKYSSATDALFINFDTADPGKRLQRAAVQHIFRKVRKDLKMDKPLSPHSCRHGFATKGVENNVNIFYLKEMMGHANIQNTMVYTHSNQKHLQEEYRRIYEKRERTS